MNTPLAGLVAMMTMGLLQRCLPGGVSLWADVEKVRGWSRLSVGAALCAQKSLQPTDL